MRAQGHGTIVVLSSVAAIRPRKANFVYGAAKAGLDAFGRGLADSLHGTGVDVLLVRPGFVIGRMTAGMAAGAAGHHACPRWARRWRRGCAAGGTAGGWSGCRARWGRWPPSSGCCPARSGASCPAEAGPPRCACWWPRTTVACVRR